ncbi:protein FAM36A isoform B [Alligator mississippiensis]|uniref:Cytochrome c oxidase assembly protein COX20, mitochondrial n=1 Tax=Alligator mississippiensis TaxID=8496 RepID=A0A151MH71_ALLMI|nr:protein FAM36A isoform B [Alligator mississippiensis]
METEDREDSKKSFKILGILDVQKVPCARESILYGSLGSLVVATGHFLATSRVKRSFDFGVGGFILTTLGYWFYCRYNYAKLRIQQRIIQEGMKNKIIYEGTQFDPEIKEKNNQGCTFRKWASFVSSANWKAAAGFMSWVFMRERGVDPTGLECQDTRRKLH